MLNQAGMILGFDPSSMVVGYGAIHGGHLVEAGLITPESPRAASYDRVMGLCDDVETLLDRLGPAVVLIEWTKGKVGQRHQGHGAGLAVYGTGVGAVALQCRLWARGRRDVTVEPVCENEWTRGVPKRTRAAAIEQLYPELAGVTDPGLDIHDAVGLAEWWRRRQLME